MDEKTLHIAPPALVVKAAAAMLIMLAVFLIAQTYSTLVSARFIGTGVTATNTITVDGIGDVSAPPDIATFTVTVQDEQKDAKTAQANVTKAGNSIVAYLRDAGIPDKDVQASNVSVYPQYDWVQGACPMGSYCPGKQQLRGYQANETFTVKVRDLGKVGDIASGVVSHGATQVDGPNFSVDEPDALQAQARDEAITDARAKAEQLAKALGVQLVRVVGFSDGGGVRPMMYAAKAMAMDSAAGEAAPSPILPTGENKVSASVSVTYEIR
jgi:uncharacterized protein YggE